VIVQVQRKRAAMTAGRRRLLAEDASTGPHGGLDRHQSIGCTAGGVQSGHEQNITLIMIVVILVFMLCNAPARLVQVRLISRTLPQPQRHVSALGNLSVTIDRTKRRHSNLRSLCCKASCREKLTGEDLSRYLNKIESISLRKA